MRSSSRAASEANPLTPRPKKVGGGAQAEAEWAEVEWAEAEREGRKPL
jgi:hypothetical protein